MSFFSAEVLFVVVLYKRKLVDVPIYQLLCSVYQSTGMRLTLYVYNNSPADFGDHPPADGAVALQVMEDSRNSGVSRAYNMAFDHALKTGKRWLFLFDQDTAFDRVGLDRYFQSVSSHPGIRVFTSILTDRKGPLSPFRFFFRKRIPDDGGTRSGLFIESC